MLTKIELDVFHRLANDLRDFETSIRTFGAAEAIDALITEVINLQAKIQRMEDHADHIAWGHCDL